MYQANEDKIKQIETSFTYHSPKESQQERYVILRDNAKKLAYEILTFVPPGREQALAITKLEETIMWANKGIACGE